MAGTNVGRILSAATLIAGVMWGGCTDVNLGAAQYRCSWDGDCPPGSSCDSYGWCSSGQGGWQPDGASPDGNTSDGSSGGGGSYVDTSSGGGEEAEALRTPRSAPTPVGAIRRAPACRTGPRAAGATAPAAPPIDATTSSAS